ncbi:unnamed protein product, partial [Laminaria digitata]
MLRYNPAARASFESAIGGRIVNFGLRNDGKMTIQRMGPGMARPMGMGFMNPMAGGAFGWMSGITGAVSGML